MDNRYHSGIRNGLKRARQSLLTTLGLALPFVSGCAALTPRSSQEKYMDDPTRASCATRLAGQTQCDLDAELPPTASAAQQRAAEHLTTAGEGLVTSGKSLADLFNPCAYEKGMAGSKHPVAYTAMYIPANLAQSAGGLLDALGGASKAAIQGGNLVVLVPTNLRTAQQRAMFDPGYKWQEQGEITTPDGETFQTYTTPADKPTRIPDKYMGPMADAAAVLTSPIKGLAYLVTTAGLVPNGVKAAANKLKAEMGYPVDHDKNLLARDRLGSTKDRENTKDPVEISKARATTDSFPVLNRLYGTIHGDQITTTGPGTAEVTPVTLQNAMFLNAAYMAQRMSFDAQTGEATIEWEGMNPRDSPGILKYNKEGGFMLMPNESGVLEGAQATRDAAIIYMLVDQFGDDNGGGGGGDSSDITGDTGSSIGAKPARDITGATTTSVGAQ